uniref:Rho termination factor N-terminal domain-containing protein n=1 Tax=Salix viminalis TaxID=40686 RepID=A0A6N2K0I5_SALVM
MQVHIFPIIPFEDINICIFVFLITPHWNFMDWDLWGPPNDIVAEESGFDNSQRDFYFDVIEEAALNEKYCVRVLRILIKKADTEILELEQDLLSLQTELAWVDNEDWPDVCCNALREKIDFLDISIKNLRNKEKNDIEVRLLMYTQPVETLDEIMKAVFRNYICKKDKQLKDAIVVGSSSDAPRHTGLDKEKRLSNCNLETITSENTKDCSSTPTEHGAALSPSLNLQEKKTGNSEPTSADIKDFSPQSSEVAPDFSDENKSLSFWGPRSTGKRDAREHGVAPRDEKQIQSSSSKSTHNGRHGLKPVKVEPTENSVSNSTIYALENAVVLSYKEKTGDSDSTATKEVEEHSSISTPDVVISGSSSKPMTKKTDLRKTVKPAGAIIKNVSAEALRRAAGLNGKKYNSDCALGTFKQANCSSSDTGQKLCEFAPTAAQKRIVKESKIAAAHDIVSLKSPQKTNGKNKSRLIVKLRETDLTGTENCALTSLLEMQDHEGKNAAKLQPDEEKPTLAEIQMTEISAHEERSNMKLFSNPQKEKGKRNIKSNPPILHEIGFSKLIHNSSSSSISESNKKRKSRVGPQNSSLNQTLSEKITKKAVRPDKGEAKDHGAATDSTPNSLSEPRNKKKECVNFPHLSGIEDSSVQLDLSSSLGDTIDARKDDLSAEKSCSTCDSSYEVVASGIADISNLKDLRLPKLRTIAGRLKLTKYSKLRKELLLELIAERLAN